MNSTPFQIPNEPENRPADQAHPALRNDGLLLLLTVLFIIARIHTNGILFDAVAAQDTQSYICCSGRNFLSLDGYSCGRSATLPFLYKVLAGDQPIQIGKLSEPFFGTEPRLTIHPGTQPIIIFQTLLAIASWVFFVWTVVTLLRNELPRVMAAVILYLFAFVPQLSDWDSILLSESVSFSLFVILLAFLLRALTGFLARNRPGILIFDVIGLLASSFAWIFTRDTNSYMILLLTLVMIGIFVRLIATRRGFLKAMLSLVTVAALAVLFAFHQSTFRTGERWVLPMLNNYTANVFPYEERVKFFEERGMPVSETLLEKKGSAEYNNIFQEDEFLEWFKRDGMKTYLAFMVEHPLLFAQMAYFQLDEFFSENIQPFFYGRESDKPRWAEPLGNLLHPLSSSVLLIDLLLMLILLFGRLSPNQEIAHRESSWTIFVGIVLLGAVMMTFVSYFGEVRSIWRHVLSGVMPLRLGMWLALLALLDRKMTRTE